MTTTSYPETFQVGQTFEAGAWRLHRYAASVRITHLANAGKRGKVCDDFRMWRRGLHDSSELSDVALRLACLAVDGLGLDEMAVEIEVAAGDCGAMMERKWCRGVDVAPGGFPPIRIDGARVRVVAEYDSWSVLDVIDTNNEPTLIPLKNKDRKAFYAWAKKNEEALKTMRFNDVMRALREAGIGYHYYCAVD